jgi:hypothetical protein
MKYGKQVRISLPLCTHRRHNCIKISNEAGRDAIQFTNLRADSQPVMCSSHSCNCTASRRVKGDYVRATATKHDCCSVTCDLAKLALNLSSCLSCTTIFAYTLIHLTCKNIPKTSFRFLNFQDLHPIILTPVT